MDWDRIIADIKADEGWRAHAYQDHRGFWTIGYGFLIDERKGGHLPRVVADFWLQHILDERVSMLRNAFPSWGEYPEGVKRALVNMSFQLGVAGLLGFHDMIQALNCGDYQKAAAEALDSKWASEKQTPERARRVAEWIRTA